MNNLYCNLATCNVILYIIFTGDCDIGSSKYNILLAASVFSFLLPLLSIVSLGGFILSVGRKKDEGVMSIDVRLIKLCSNILTLTVS